MIWKFKFIDQISVVIINSKNLFIKSFSLNKIYLTEILFVNPSLRIVYINVFVITPHRLEYESR